MKPTLAFQNPSPPPPAAVASGRAAHAVRLVAVSGADGRQPANDRFAGPPVASRQIDDERWPLALRVLVMAMLSLTTWAAIVGGLVALFR